ncbi:MAG: DUF6494 family protein [Dongiaceae bacterium]
MNEDNFNMSVRQFLKQVGITSQREIENAVRAAIEAGTLKGTETLSARMTLAIERLGVQHVVEQDIELG